jgi:oligopeptidase B
VLHERERGLSQARVHELSSDTEHRIEFPEAAWSTWPEDNAEFETATYRFGYESLLTPDSVYDYDMNTRERALRKEEPVLGGYDRTRYQTERLVARAADGADVPITVVFPKGMALDGSHPLLLDGYGAYGTCNDPWFESTRLSLLDRGVVFAIAHVRGGGEMGRGWYLDGKFHHKPNTFTDFIAAATHLVEAGYTSPERLAIRGESAGGLLIGAVVNQRPDLFRAAVAEVPFVDVVTTMLDETIPLTAIEWEEWGDPRQREFFDTMVAYSPYDNVAAHDYPDLLVTAGLNDPRVGYWEPAKWTARIRSRATGPGQVVLRTNLGAGHSGASGRYGFLEDEAWVLAWVLDRLGVAP